MSELQILKLGEFDQGNDLADFYCNDFRSHLNAHSKSITVPHKHNFFLTVLFTQGSGIHEIDFEKYEVCSGSVFMINPGQAHHWELSQDADGIIFFHSQEFYELTFTKHSIFDFPFFETVQSPSAIFLKGENTDQFLQIFKLVLLEYRHRDQYSYAKIVSLLNCLYIDLSRLYFPSSVSQKSPISSGYISALERLIEANFKVDKLPSFYANKLNITIRHLNRLTQESLGKTTTQLIAERVMLEAKRLIVYDASSLANIAYELGYDDYAYFSRLFKRWTGFTPSAFSRLYKK